VRTENQIPTRFRCKYATGAKKVCGRRSDNLGSCPTHSVFEESRDLMWTATIKPLAIQRGLGGKPPLYKWDHRTLFADSWGSVLRNPLPASSEKAHRVKFPGERAKTRQSTTRSTNSPKFVVLEKSRLSRTIRSGLRPGGRRWGPKGPQNKRNLLI